MRLARFLIGLCSALLAACSNSVATPQASLQPTPRLFPTNTSQPVPTQTVTLRPTTSLARSCEDWQSWPVIPDVSETARSVYQRGQQRDRNPNAFSKIGDGEISAEWFFTAFDLGASYYHLGPYQDLQAVIDWFAGSFGRIGVATRRGFNTQKILDPSMRDVSLCEINDSPLACELRLHKPAVAILSLGTNQVWQPDEFETGMRQILEELLSQDVVPILSTKGDNLEGDHRINRTIACLAQEYDLPLWNFWAAIQPLPNHGLQADGEHLTYGVTDFGNADALQTAWTIRNLSGLQALDSVWRGLTGE